MRRETYIEEYNELAHTDGLPFVPGAVWKDLFFSAAILFAVAFCAAVFGPYGPKGVPDPSIIQTVPKPDFFFLWIYTVLSYLPPSMETPFILIVPAVGGGDSDCAAVCGGCGREELVAKAGRRVCRDVYRGVLWGVYASGHVHAVEPAYGCLERSGGAGAVSAEPHAAGAAGCNVFQEKQCRNCHALGGLGGQRGPELDDVATRLTEDQMNRQVLLGGGNMPAYGSALSPAETTALVQFLDTMHPNYQPAAEDASRRVVGQTGGVRPERRWSVAAEQREDAPEWIDDSAICAPELGALLRAWSLPGAAGCHCRHAVVSARMAALRGRVRGSCQRWRAVCFLADCWRCGLRWRRRLMRWMIICCRRTCCSISS